MNRKIFILVIIFNIFTMQLHAVNNEKWIAAGIITVLGSGYYQFIAKPERIEQEQQFLTIVKKKKIEENDYGFCKNYLQEGGNINVVDEKGSTALHYAAQNGHTKLINFFIEQCPNLSWWQELRDWAYSLKINKKNKEGNTSLHEAVHFGQQKAIEILIKKGGADREARNNLGDTPLLCATKKRDVKTVKQLVDLGAHKCVCNNAGESSLYVASKNGDTLLISLLLSCCKEKIIGQKANNRLSLLKGCPLCREEPKKP